LLLRNQGLSSVSHIQLTSRCAGAGREHSQAASPNCPTEIFHTIDVRPSFQIEVGWGAEIAFFLFHEFESSLGWEFGLLQESHEICKIYDFQVLRLLLGDCL